MASPPISIKLRCTSWKQLAAIYERDLKRSAVFLKSAAPPPIGTSVRINLTLPTQTLIILNGTVAHHVAAGELGGRGPGVDIELHSVPQSAMWIIESALDAAQREDRGNDTGDGHDSATDADLEEGGKFVAAEEELLAALSQELESLRKLNPFQVLGVGYETGDTEIRAAFGALTKRYHPDRFARYESSEARRVAAEIFILIRNAYQRIENPESRTQMIQQLQKRRVTQRPIQPAPPPIRRDQASSAVEEPDPVVSTPPRPAPPERVPEPEPISERTPERALEPPPLEPPPLEPAPEPGPPPRSDAGDDDDDIATGDSPEMAHAKVNAFLDRGQFKEAIILLKIAAKRWPGESSMRVGLELAEGLRALAARDRLEAAQRFEAVLEMDPENERAARELAEMRRLATEERKNMMARLLKQKD